MSHALVNMADDKSIVEQVRSIAENAIGSINRLTSLVEQAGTATNNSHSAERSRSEIPLGRTMPTSCSAVSELQRRFPTVSRGRANRNCTGRYRSYSSNSRPYPAVSRAGRPVGRPMGSETVSRDVVVVEIGAEKIPTKAEKPYLERNGRVILGVDINRNWDASKLHEELESLMTGEMEGLGFEIVKNTGGTLLTPNIPAGKEIDSKLLLKSIAPSGSIYLRLLEELPTGSKELKTSAFEVSSFKEEIPEAISPDSDDSEPISIDLTKIPQSLPDARSDVPMQVSFDIQSVIKKAKGLNLIEPVEVLRFLQKEVVCGRKLEVPSSEDTIEGEVNFITVDRDNILQTTFSELDYITNYRITFSVDFMGEEAIDLGGPRKEWIRLMNHAIKEKYFDHGLRPLLSQEYYFVGVMLAVAILQNGQLPNFLEEDVLQQIMSSSECSDPCIVQIQRGLEELGMLSALKQLPMLVHLLRPDAQRKMNVQKLLHILKPNFSEEGSNALKKEKEVYQQFVKYVREVAASRRVCGQTTLDLSHILQFATGASEEPILGFQIQPAVEFVLPVEMRVQGAAQKEGSTEGSFIPSAHTCTNVLQLPRPTDQFPLPLVERLFALYDIAFSQPYFGKQ